MKSKQLFQALVVLMMLFSAMGSPARAQAQAHLTIVDNPTHVDATHAMFMGDILFIPTTPVVPIPTLPPQAKASVAFDKSEIIRGGKAATLTAALDLRQIPSEGYTSVEFDCNYRPANSNELVLENLIIPTNGPIEYVFGQDPAIAIQGPANGSFIVAVAGTNGSKALPQVNAGAKLAAPPLARSPTIFTIDARSPTQSDPTQPSDLTTSGDAFLVQSLGPQATPTSRGPRTPIVVTIMCKVRVSTAEKKLINLGSLHPATLIIRDAPTPAETATPAFTSTPLPANTPTATATPLPAGLLNGKILAGKPVTVTLHDAADDLVASMPANSDGTFGLTAPAGTYTVVATADGFLSAAGSVTLTSGGTSSMPIITLVAGDIDGNNVIDQFDVLTIGMNYNTASPAVADLNNDGIINVLDLEALAANYRKEGPIPWP